MRPHEVWTSFVEQGLVILLWTIAQGHDCLVHSSSTLSFPEEPLRSVCRRLIDQLRYYLESNVIFRNRVVHSLIYSGNQKLKMNVWTGIVYLCRGNEKLSSLMWTTSVASQSSSVASSKPGKKTVVASPTVAEKVQGMIYYHMMQQMATNDIKSFRSLLRIIRLNIEELLTSMSTSLVAPRRERSNLSVHSGIHGPTVLVDDEGRLVKMVCPNTFIVTRHSPQLATLIASVRSI